MTTKAQEIVEVLVTAAPGAPAIQAEIIPRLEANPLTVATWQAFRLNPENGKAALIGALELFLAADTDLAQKLDKLLAEARPAQPVAHTTNINTGGGAYIGRGVQMGNGGRFAGRDQINYESQQTTTSIFQDIYRQVETSPTLPPADKADVKAELQEVEQELAKGEQADETFIQRRLRNIQRMAPDILEVVLATFANPLAGLGLVAKKVAEKMKAQGEGAGGG